MGLRDAVTDRKKPGVAFWATVALVAVLVYFASVGPAAWLGYRGWLPGSVVEAFYWPIIHGPKPIYDAADEYAVLWQ